MSGKKAHVITYGCAQNENDSERLRGMLLDMGYTLTNKNDEADVILFNTCAVRENAEQRVYSNIGALKALKAQNPEILIGVCGCMVQQNHVTQHIKNRFPHIDFVFGTHAISRFPQILHSATQQRIFDIAACNESLSEGMPHDRMSTVIATVSIMYGCNNFCSYCIVPHVRGREKSRSVRDIIYEAEGLAAQGYKEITLLGQNVNSYSEIPFYKLLELVSKVDGIERIRFISSHPKDVTDNLIYTIASNPKVCKQLHLPFQAGSNNVLSAMNRRYTREDYLKIIKQLKAKIPGITLTSDVIVGFPTETNDDFEQTIDMVKTVEFDMLFTFLYSRRKGTPAEKIEPVLAPDEIKNNFDKLLALQNEISAKQNNRLVGKTVKVLVEGESKNDKKSLSGRTDGGKIVNFKGSDTLIGKIIDVKITNAASWSLSGSVL
ncbi:MAG: tRNA (N6-isopentenyl adenosine(37)-C2)-methylthiotransferase MiaB [Firmicutes bacterium]|nr:tRNA (N6-isopentenyl adenosine(37)-C2)-methylthiotransferase MiaB [Bacillota bacterium]